MTVELSNTLDIVRKSLNGSTCRRERSRIGQFFTPAMIARYMASLFERVVPNVRLLDPGAGTGVLFATSIEILVSRKHRPLSIEVVAYENDNHVLPYLKETMERCKIVCKDAGITFRGEIRAEDFIAAAIAQVDEGLFAAKGERFTHVILNPPYKKINAESAERRLLHAAGIEVSNLYAAFVWLTARMLENEGEMVAITPRSFCNGPYFRRFRVDLLDMMSIRHIHVFESRNKAFGDDDVLQENIIYYAVKGAEKPEYVLLSASDGMDFENANIRSIPYTQIILPGDRDAFIHLVLTDDDSRVTERMRSFTATLDKLGLDVSTGPVVDFRVRKYIHLLPDKRTVPLIYPCHFEDGFIKWPAKLKKKPNAIEVSPHTKALMVDAGYYVLTKRFSAKEERRRVVAAIYDPSMIEAPIAGFENHLNYFHDRGKGLPANLSKGLALYLNSTLFDQCFRIFSGHTQVNATDLRKMRYPSREQLLRLGLHVKHRMPDQKTVDAILKRECENND
ncbi:MAG: Eco57I restriction-modification methylase domain-containing protein [Nitrospirae bacterium]|nr:Eco57I restriction-modification methylase domain-containing protein [Nitrospirota bacterium]